MRAIQTIALIAAASQALAGCVFGDQAPPPATVGSPAVCEALRPAFPLKEASYDSTRDTAETVAGVKATNLRNRAANARFKVACP